MKPLRVDSNEHTEVVNQKYSEFTLDTYNHWVKLYLPTNNTSITILISDFNNYTNI